MHAINCFDLVDRVIGNFVKFINSPVEGSRLLYERSILMNAHSPNLDNFSFSIYRPSLPSGHILCVLGHMFLTCQMLSRAKLSLIGGEKGVYFPNGKFLVLISRGMKINTIFIII